MENEYKRQTQLLNSGINLESVSHPEHTDYTETSGYPDDDDGYTDVVHYDTVDPEE